MLYSHHDSAALFTTLALDAHGAAITGSMFHTSTALGYSDSDGHEGAKPTDKT